MRHKIFIGDCTEILRSLDDGLVDMVFADPPYGISKSQGLGWAYSKHITMQEAWDMFTRDSLFEFNLRWISEALRVVRPGGSFWVTGSFHNIYQLGFILQHLDMKINNSIVWFKPNAQPNITTRMFTESTEYLIWAVKNHSKKKWTFNYEVMKALNKGKQMRNLCHLRLNSKSEKWAGEHPTQKPFELLKRVILSSTNEGDIVLDPFLGSGTTSVVAEYYGRNSIGIEKNKDYLSIIKKRMNPPQKSIQEQDLRVEYIGE
ncbi:MAG: site-specific DNA-methyltransferase [Candidatus Thermoplasmatota archaeon]|nr:site-specific DNA-methyltransferase [Candidatus Thermoplasmatota archaeon]